MEIYSEHDHSGRIYLFIFLMLTAALAGWKLLSSEKNEQTVQIEQPVLPTSGISPTPVAVTVTVSPSISIPAATNLPRVTPQLFIDTQISESTNESVTLSNSRLRFTFTYDPQKEFVLECPNIGETSDFTRYYLIDLAENKKASCNTIKQPFDLYISRKELIDDIIVRPTFSLKKKQFINEFPQYAILMEDSIEIARIKGTRIQLGEATDPQLVMVDRSFFEYRGILYILSSRLIGEDYKYKFL